MEIKTTFGGPCIYKQGFFKDGTKTGKILDTEQTYEQLDKQLRDSVKSGRDDSVAFVNGVLSL